MATREQSGRPPDDLTHSEFGRQVHDALLHLHDLIYLQTHPLTRLVAGEGTSQSRRLGQALGRYLLEAVEALRPEKTAEDAARRGYELLRLRYVEALDAEAVQARLVLSRRQYHREHQRALAAVVSILQQRWALGQPEQPGQVQTLGLASTAAGAAPPGVELRVPLTSFVGRDRELAEVRQLLEITRLLTLTGSGGCGKTRLALQVAAGVASDYPDGVCVVELASLADPSLVPSTVALALGIGEEHERTILAVLVDRLRAKHLLLVLDNCEHLLTACATLVEALLGSCPGLRILATSREALNIGGETRFRVPPLGTPPPEHWLDVAEELTGYEAVQLFVERAQAVQPGFRLTADKAPAAAEVCWRLDGIPLAIELAAARVRVLTVEQIARRLDDRFRLLTDGTRTAIPRHQTLLAAMDWSHDLLGPAARAVFRRLAVFAGGCTLEAAEAVCGDWLTTGEPGEEAVGRDDVLDLLAQLVDRSLVLVEEAEGEARFRCLETIRQYAAERLAQADEEAEARRRHCRWCLSLASRAEPELYGPSQVRWFERLEREHDNLRAALTWSQAQPDGAAEVELSAALALFWRFRHIGEGRRWLGHAVTRGVCGALWLRAHVVDWAGHLECLYGGDWAKARSLLEEALALFRGLGDGAGVARTLRHLSLVAVAGAGMAAALPLYEEAVVESYRSGDQREIRFNTLLLGYTAYESGDRARGRRLVEEGLANCRRYGDWMVMCYGLGYLASIALQEGDSALARRVLDDRLARARATGSKVLVADTLGALGDVARIEGDLSAARAHLRESLLRVRDTDERLYIVSWLERCAALEAVIGNADRAARLFGAAEAVSERTGASGTFVTLLFLPRIHYDRERAAVHQVLGEQRFVARWEAGRELTLDEAVAFALKVS